MGVWTHPTQVRGDEELDTLCDHAVFLDGGIIPHGPGPPGAVKLSSRFPM